MMHVTSASRVIDQEIEECQMKRIICTAACIFSVAALVSAAVAQSRPDEGDPTLAHKLGSGLGMSWTVRLAHGSIEANRTTQQLPVDHFDIRLDEQKRWVHHQEPEMTADFAEGSVHLAGRANDCDDVIEAARHFAGIGGVNGLVIDTRCDPRQ
jgi:hypothetical protein